MITARPVQFKRSFFDRRGSEDRRQVYNIHVVDQLGYDRRMPSSERRKTSELRQGWTRVTQWSSVWETALSV